MPPMLPGPSLQRLLKALAYGAEGVKFHPRERQLVLAVLAEADPPTAADLARKLRRRYCHTKSEVRDLLRWGVLWRDGEGGLYAQPDLERW